MAKRRSRRTAVERDAAIRMARTLLEYGLRLAGDAVPPGFDEFDADELVAIARRRPHAGGFRHALALLAMR